MRCSVNISKTERKSKNYLSQDTLDIGKAYAECYQATGLARCLPGQWHTFITYNSTVYQENQRTTHIERCKWNSMWLCQIPKSQ